MSLHRVRAIIRRRVRYRATTGGALFLLGVAITGVGAFLSGNNLLFLVFAAMMALLLVSGFLSQIVLAGLELELLLPEHVAARMPTSARIRVRNLKRFMPSFSIELAGRGDAARRIPAILGEPVYFPVIPGRATIETAVQVVFPTRGRHRENLFVIATKFPFGFLLKSTTVTLRRETIVYPSIQPSPSSEELLNSIAEEIETQLRGEGRDFYRIRPYQSDDSAHHVDWKSTAHTGSLQVREFTLDQKPCVEIFFDRRIRPGEQAAFEALVEKCASVVWTLAEREGRLWLKSQRFSQMVPEEARIYDLLRFLAMVEPLLVQTSREDELPEAGNGESNVQIFFRAGASE